MAQLDILLVLLLAVISPIIGSVIGVLKQPSEKFMYVMLAFAGGVMLAISFLQLIPESLRLSSVLICVAGVTTGVIIMFALDKLIPHIHPELCLPEEGTNLKLTAIYLILGIFLHNFPEGMAVALWKVSGIKVGLIVALAIAIHNIPEGICTSAPYFYCTKNRLKSFLLSSSTAIPILVGYLVALFLYEQITSSATGFIVGATAGFMIYITGDKILPTSFGKNPEHTTIFSFIIGILFVIILGSL
jgi:zinc transporter, ZIP family